MPTAVALFTRDLDLRRRGGDLIIRNGDPPELAGLAGRAVHEPWLSPGGQRRRPGYERRLVGAAEVPR
jgi:hypothetical protein